MPNELEIENKIKEVLSEIFKDLIINTKQTFDIFLKEKNPADLIALYDFYYYTAKWQKTNQPKATIHYVMKGLKWGEQKVRKRKQQLVGLGLIQDIRKKNANKYLGWYIKINYIWGENTILDKLNTTLLENNRVNTTLLETTLLENNTVETKPTNALSVNTLNALSVNNTGLAKPTTRKDISFKKEDYERVITEFQSLKEVSLQGNEFLPVQQAIKTMFLSKRSVDDIIGCMQWLADKAQSGEKKWEWTQNWTIKTVQLKLPEFLGGKLEKQEKLIIPEYAKKWIK